jgi:predicted RNA-binding Zn ribbon-like protein
VKSTQTIDSQEHIMSLKLLGGHLCLDFPNTLDGRDSDDSIEYLTNYADLVIWSQRAGLLLPHESQSLLHEASLRTNEADATFQYAIVLREIIYRIFSAIAADMQPLTADLNLLNAELSRALPYAQIVPAEKGFAWGWRDKDKFLDSMLWAIMCSVAELLISDDKENVRECLGRNCGWLFLDTSKNHSRRWCNMASCGNRTKSRAYYERKKTKDKQRPENIAGETISQHI